MPSFSNLDDRRGGKSLTVRSIQPTHRMRPRNAVPLFPVICRLFALLLALAVAPTVAFAAEGAHENGHINDLTGAWIVTNTALGDGGGVFLAVNTFTSDGGWVGSVQGEGACCPIGTPGFGVWEKTGPKTFALTFASVFYDQFGSLVATGKGRQTLTLTSSDQFVGKAKFVGTAPNGTVAFSGESTLVGQRVKVEPLP
jgi:hypothetical protein